MRPHHLAPPLVVLALLVGGCSDSGDDDPSATETTRAATASPTSTPTAAPVDLSIAPPNETAKQFIRRWVALSNEMQHTGITTNYLAVAGPDCFPCHRYARRVAAIFRNGGSISGGAEDVLRLVEESRGQWVATIEAAPSQVTEKAGAEVQTFEGGTHRLRIWVSRHDATWVVIATQGAEP